MWCLGVLLYVLGCGVLPFRARTLEELHEKIIKAKVNFPDCKDPPLSDDFKDLARGLL